MSLTGGKIVLFTLFVVFVDFIGMGIIVSTIIWYVRIINYLIKLFLHDNISYQFWWELIHKQVMDQYIYLFIYC